MRFTVTKKDPMDRTDKNLTFANWLDEAKARAEGFATQPGPYTWKDNGDYASGRIRQGAEVWPVYDLWAGGEFTGISVRDSVSWNAQAKLVKDGSGKRL